MKLAVLQHISTRSNELFGLPPKNDWSINIQSIQFRAHSAVPYFTCDRMNVETSSRTGA